MLLKEKYEGVIFDLDGTLLNTLGTYTHLMNILLENNDFKTHDSEIYKGFIGNGARNFIKQSIPEKNRNDQLIEKLLNDFNKLYESKYAVNSVPYMDVLGLLKEFESNNIKMAVLSNKLDDLTSKCVSHFFNEIKFECVIGQSAQYHKPEPNGVFDIVKSMETSPDKVVLIGDTEVDLKTANNANIDSIAVTWGFRDKADLLSLSPKYIVDNVNQLKQLFLS